MCEQGVAIIRMKRYMNYIGSKYSLRYFLEEGILKNVNSDCKVFCDVFAGTGVVGVHLSRRALKLSLTTSNTTPIVSTAHFVGISQVTAFDGVLDDGKIVPTTLICDIIDMVLEYLNNLNGRSGFIYRNYCPGGTEKAEFKRQYFSDENGRRCDAIRMQIEDWWQAGKLTEDEYLYLLASLIDGADRVANTASVYGAFLKHIKKSALKPLQLKRLAIVESDEEHESTQCKWSRVGRASVLRCTVYGSAL